jgi:hypothetical protein
MTEPTPSACPCGTLRTQGDPVLLPNPARVFFALAFPDRAPPATVRACRGCGSLYARERSEDLKLPSKPKA